MRYFLLYTAILILIALLAGCDNNQPLSVLLDQSDRHSSEIVDEFAECFEGVKVEDGKYLPVFDKMCVDGVISGAEVGTPTLPPGVTATNIETIVTDVASGSMAYEKSWVYVEGLVTSDLTDGKRALLLETGNDGVAFRVSSFVKASQLSRWTKGNRYGLILFITSIEDVASTGKTTIFSRVDDPENIKKGKSLFTPTTSDVIPASIAVMLESFRRGESYYIGKRVGFLDTVKVRNDDQTSESHGTTYDSLVVYQEQASLFATGRDRVSIYPTLRLFNGQIDDKYSKGSFHNFEVTIHYFSGESFFNPEKVSIVGYFEDKTFLP